MKLHLPKTSLKFLFIAVLFSFSNLSWGQTDDFTDGNFTASPAWSGNTADFSILTGATLTSGTGATDGSYLASGTTTGNVALTTPSTEVTEWKFSLGSPTFAPATLNHFGVVLMSSVAVSGNITTSTWNGYFLRIGLDGSTDPIELWKKSGSGAPAKVGDFPSSPNYGTGALAAGLNIRVTRNSSGVFQLYYSTGFTYAATPTNSAGTLTDNTFTTSSYFGVYTVFANPGTTRRVYIDNIELGVPAGCVAPTTQASGFTGSATGQTTATVGWTRGNGTAGVLVVARAAAAVNADPVSGTGYTANAAFTSGTQIGTGNYVVYSGTGTSANITGLTAGTTYHFAVYEYNTTDTCYNLTELTGSLTTNSPPTLGISGTLSENTTLNTGQVALTLTNDTFADATLSAANFTLNNAPSGVTISSVTYVSPTSATITLAYNGTDFDTNVTTFNVTVSNAELTLSATPLTSGNLTITAITEVLTLGTITSFGTLCVNELSVDRTFTISSATALKAGNISLAALSGFSYSETQLGTYTSTLSFAHAGGTLAAKTIYVKFLPTSAISFNGNIAVSGVGAPAVNRSVVGSGTDGVVSVTNVTAATITTTTAVSGGSALSTTCGTITAKGVVWGTTSNPTIPSVSSTNDGTGTTSYSSNLTGLSASTTYFYRAYATNSNGVTSYGANSSFTTPCAAVVPSYTNDFSVFPGTCWNANLSGGTPATGPSGTTPYWAADGFLNSGTTGAVSMNLYQNNRAGWLRSIPVNLSAGGYRVKFNYGVTAFNTTTPAATVATDDTVKFLISSDGGATWTILQSWDSPNSTISNTSNDYIYDLTSYTNANTVFAFYASDGTTDNTPDYDFSIDNFVVELLPSPCTTPLAQPTSLTFNTVTYNSIAGSFTTSGATKYLVVESLSPSLSATPVDGVAYTAGQSLGGGTIVQASASSSFTASALASQTAYHFFVFAYNDNCTGEPYYLTTTPLTASSTTLEAPCAQESFANICVSSCTPATSTYGTRTWTGNGGGTWSVTNSRTDQTVNGNAVTVRSGIITAPSTAGGIGSISMTTKLPFSDTAGNLTVKVNGNTVGTIAYSSATQTFTISNINIAGSVVVTIEETNNARVSVDDITWTCYTPTSTTWENGVWSYTVPTTTLDAIIKGVYSTGVNGVFSAKSLTIDSGSFTINSGNSITVVNGITNNMTAAAFVVENNANLLQQGTTNNNTGSITVKRNSSAVKRMDYTLWSSPVAGQGVYSFSPFTFGNRFYVYRTATNVYNNADVGFSLTGLNPDGVNGTDSNAVQFAQAKGYLIRMPWDHPTTATVWNGTFTGVPNNGDIPFTMTNGGVGQRFNLVGNPYPSPISMTQFVSDNNTSITGTLYFWRETNGTTVNNAYCTWAGGTFITNGQAQVFNPNGIIRTGQGFIVEAVNASTSLVFKNGQRSSDNSNQFFRNANVTNDVAQINRFWLNLTNASGEFSQMAAGYMTDATDGVDLYDGKNINTGNVLLNSILDNTDYTIQGKALPFNASDVIPLSCKITNAGEYTIAIDHTDGLFTDSTQAVYLKDNLTSTEHNLQTGAYTFTSAAGTFNDRFEITYQSQLGVENPGFTASNIIIYTQNNDFVISTGNIMMSSIKVFDIRGRLLQEKTAINANQTTINGGIANEVLLVQITSEEGLVVTKKVIR